MNRTAAPPRPRQRILAACRALILDGTLPRGGIMPSEHELADRLVAKRGAVHLALKELEREGLIRPLANGRRIVAGGRPAPPISCLTNTICVFTTLPQLDGLFPTGWGVHVQFGLINALCRAGRHVLLLHPHSLADAQRQADLVASSPLGFAALAIDGPVWDDLAPLMHQLHDHGVSVVTNRVGADFADFDRVTHDHAAGAEQLTQVLLARGRRRILRCWVKRPPDSDPLLEWLDRRDEGHERAMIAAGIPPIRGVDLSGPPIDYFSDRLVFEREVARLMECLDARLTGAERCDALMLTSDGMLPQIAEACRRLGREPGYDLDLVGYDNYWHDLDHQRFAAITPLATVDKDNASMGAAMAALLEDRLAGRLSPAPQLRLTPPKLLQTALTKPPLPLDRS